jgi:hypothetical protein
MPTHKARSTVEFDRRKAVIAKPTPDAQKPTFGANLAVTKTVAVVTNGSASVFAEVTHR